MIAAFVVRFRKTMPRLCACKPKLPCYSAHCLAKYCERSEETATDMKETGNSKIKRAWVSSEPNFWERNDVPFLCAVWSWCSMRWTKKTSNPLRASAETRHSGPAGEPAGQADTGRSLRSEGHHQGGLQGRGNEVR